MARPLKSGVDYFPHSCKDGKTMFIIENKYGNDGYAFWFKLLEILGSSQGHFYDCNKQESIEFLTAKTRLDWDKCQQILSILANLEAIDSQLWAEKIIWSDNFFDGIRDAYRKRKDNFLPQKPVIPGKTPVIPGKTPVIPGKTPVIPAESTQRKGKERKGNNNKGEDNTAATLFLKYIQNFKSWKIDLIIDQKWFIEEIEQNDEFKILDLSSELDGWFTWLEQEQRKQLSKQKNMFPKNFKSSLINRLKLSIKFREERKKIEDSIPGQITLKCYFCEHECQAYPGEHDLICAGCGAPYHKQQGDSSWTRNEPPPATGRLAELAGQVGKEISKPEISR